MIVRQNRILVPVLLTATLTVWGAVIYQLNNSLNEPAEPAVTATRQGPVSSDKPGAIESLESLLAGLRNPFRPYRQPVRRPVVPKSVATREAPAPPPIRYRGYLADAAGGLALLETSGGLTRIVAPGEVVEGAIIRQIDKEKLKIVFEKRELEIPLSGGK